MKLILFLLVVLITNIIQGITGFAGTVIAMPFSIMLIGVDQAKVILNILGLLASIYIVATNKKYIIFKEIKKIIPIMFLGVILGQYIYSIFPLKFLLIFYGVFIILIALKGLFIKKEYKTSEIVLTLVIFMAGIIHGMFISGGPLLVIYAVKKINSKEYFRATLAPIWIILNGYLLINQYFTGIITKELAVLLIYTIPSLVIGMIIGSILCKKLSQKTFLKISYVLLLISGIALIK